MSAFKKYLDFFRNLNISIMKQIIKTGYILRLGFKRNIKQLFWPMVIYEFVLDYNTWHTPTWDL